MTNKSLGMNNLIKWMLVCVLGTTGVQAQQLGVWKDYLKYDEGVGVQVIEDKVFCAVSQGIFFIDKEDNSLNKLNKLTGLSDVGIRVMRYDSDNRVMIIGYENGNIDLYENENSIINLPDIKKAGIIGEKGINDLLFEGYRAFAATDFGIVEIDLQKKEIRNTFRIGPQGGDIKVNDLGQKGDTIYAATSKGVLKANLTTDNLLDFQNWKPLEGINSEMNCTAVEVIEGKVVYVERVENNQQNVHIRNDANEWELLRAFTENVHKVRAMGGKLWIAWEYGVVVREEDGKLSSIYTTGDDSPPPLATDIDLDAEGNLWFSHKNQGLVKMRTYWSGEFHKIDGPGGGGLFNIASVSGKLILLHGGYPEGMFIPLYSEQGFSVYENGEWAYLSRKNGTEIDSEERDFCYADFHPDNPDRYALALFYGGIMEFENGEIVARHGKEVPVIANARRVASVKYDKEGVLWATQLEAFDAPLIARSADGEQWYKFQFGDQSLHYGKEIVIPRSGHKWVLLDRAKGILVYDDNGTLDDTSDDQRILLNKSPGQGGIHDMHIKCLAEDLDGEIWYGTEDGIGVFYNPMSVFSDGEFDARRIIVDKEGDEGASQYLLKGVVVTDIAVDGANRKWVATDGAGVMLLSEDGTERLMHFTEFNSPLLSNSVSKISIDHSTGEVFFLTSIGLESFTGDATKSSETKGQSPYAYPNPVREDYEGLIALKGVPDNSEVRITDAAGNLVFETRANGSMAVWDGNKADGERVATGVYLAMATDKEGEKPVVIKILVVN